MLDNDEDKGNSEEVVDDTEEKGDVSEFENDELGNDVVVIEDVKFKIGDDELKESEDNVDGDRVVDIEALIESVGDIGIED